MSDLLLIQLLVQTFPGAAVVPDDSTDPEINEQQNIQIVLGDYLGLLKQTIVASASDVTLTVPSAPYNAAMYFVTDTPVEINVNSLGWQTVNTAFLSMAPLTTLHVRNLLVTPPNLVTIAANIRYGLFKSSS